jgi:hypothetical protein
MLGVAFFSSKGDEGVMQETPLLFREGFFEFGFHF